MAVRILLSAALFAGSALYPLAFVEPGAVPAVNLKAVRPCATRRILARNLVGAGVVGSGVLTFGLTSVAAMVSGGFDLGVQVKRARVAGLRRSEVLVAVLPHGVLEYPAFILIGAVGLLPLEVLIRVARVVPIGLGRLLSETWPLVGCSLGMLFIAGWIECHWTPQFIGWLT